MAKQLKKKAREVCISLKCKTTNDSEETKTHCEATRNCKKVKKRILIESSDSDDDCISSKTVEKLLSMETQQTVQSCDTASTADVVELTDSYCDEYSGSESEEDGYSIKHKKSILNDSSRCDIPRCSVTKATLSDENQPFETWKYLVRDYLSWLLLIDLRPSFILSFVPCTCI